MRLRVCVLLSRIFVWLLYRLVAFYRRWCYPVMQAWLKGSLHSKIAVVTNRWRRNILLLVVVCLLIFYAWPLGGQRRKVDSMQLCLDSRLQRHQGALQQNDAVLSDSEHSQFLPFIGNGYMGVDTKGDNELYVRDGRSLSLPVPFLPIVQISALGYNVKESQVIDFKSGLVRRISCFGAGRSSIQAETVAYVHRTRPSVLIQDIRIFNPSNTAVTIDIEQTGVAGWSDSKQDSKSGVTGRVPSMEYTVTTGSVLPQNAPGQERQVVAVAATTLSDNTITLHSSETWTFQMIVVVKLMDKLVPTAAVDGARNDLARSAKTELLQVLNIGSAKLLTEHVAVWQELWRSGFGISESKAEGALNGDRINATIYYVMSHMPSLLRAKASTTPQQDPLQQDLYSADRCYSGHHTLQNTNMWEAVASSQALGALVNTWLITLDKYGCSAMLKAGAEGVLQAMLLSIGELQFGDRHLEFKTHPRDLHRDYYFRRINYGNSTHVNISVIVGEDNKAVLYVALDRNDMPFYACDAGCLDPPIKLGKEMTQLPVKLTDPLTAILYITADRTHMLEMKEALHLRQVAEAPAHEQHVISLHKHGHHFGGLPVLFWASICLLILVFHLFLFKLIFNEYCQSSEPSYGRPKYNL